jgi:short-subunit dehydrogenase
MKLSKTGKIMNVASTAAFQPGPLMSVYFATKAYVLHFSEAIASELAPYGISVTVLCPGATATKFKLESEMADIKMFKNTKFAAPYDVALYGYKAMMKKQMVAVHGWFNIFLVNSNRF